MGFFARIRARLGNRSPTGGTGFKMFTYDGGSFSWDGSLYKSDIIMSAIRPYANAIGKTVPKHILETTAKDGTRDIRVNPEPYIRFLLEEPNPVMTWQKFAEWLAVCLKLNNHAFAVIQRDENGLPIAMYPINATTARERYDKSGNLYIRFYTFRGETFEFAYADLIHLRGDMTGGDFWGGSKAEQLLPLMEKLGTIDRGIISAIKNGGVIRWLLKYATGRRAEDMKKDAKDFADQFLSSANGFGVAAVDSKAEAIQIKPNDYVPNATHTDMTVSRLYAALNTNDKIVTSRYTEDDWIAYSEGQVEPDVIQLATQLSTKLFSRRKRSLGNRIVLESSNLATASMTTKLALREMVDRGAMTPNEWRAVMNYAPVPGGDVPVRRLDTAAVTETEGTNETT